MSKQTELAQLGDTVTVDGSGNVGIGTTNPVAQFAVGGAGRRIEIAGTDGVIRGFDRTSSWANIDFEAAGYTFDVSGTERMRINSGGEVGIGTSSPSYLFHVNGSGDAVAAVTAGATSIAALNLGNSTNLADGGIRYDNSADVLQFRAANAERMRIDSSGNFLVGKSTYNNDDNGAALVPNGTSWFTATNDYPLGVNRKGSAGTLITFTDDQASVGTIGTLSSRLHLTNDDTGLRFAGDADAIWPCNASGGDRDNVIDLGSSGIRFDDIYATNGTIQTSDRNEKQDIEELTDAEQRVAVAAKGLLRKFRWKSAVAEKGENARTHFGIIAQDLQAAFEAEGLDAGKYAMFISSTWTDEETGEERTRLGVRYSELLAFIIGAL